MKTFEIFGIIFILIILMSCNLQFENQQVTLTQIQIDSLKRIECDTLLMKLREKKVAKFGKINRVPKNIENSFIYLDTLINDDMKEWIKCLPDQDFGIYVHHGFGMYLRNKWGLWGGSVLANEFNEKGIYHPDDMSGIILDSYQRRLKGEEIRLLEQIQYYWKEEDSKIDSIKKE